MSPPLSSLTVVLPCLNEAEHLRDVVSSVTEAAERCASRHEIVIVDDGSADDTIAIAGQLASRDRRVQLVVHAGNRGYGEALRSGIAAAKADWVLMIDADLQLDAGELEDFLTPAQSADVVIGRRVLLRGPIGQRLSGALWRGMLHRALRLEYGDVDCGYRLARRALLQALDLRAEGALAGAELLVKSQAAGARIAEVPVHHRTRVAGHHDGTGTRWSAGTGREILHLRRWNSTHAVSRIGV